MKKKVILSMSIAAALLGGCGSTPPTPEEQAMMNKMQQALLGKVQEMGGAQALLGRQVTQQQAPAPQRAPEPTLSEADLLAKKNTIDATGGPAIFFRKKDGISINGEIFNDFEGSVANFGGNKLTGEFTYAIKNFDGSFNLKYHMANSAEAPIKIATVKKRGEQFEVRTVTGKTFTANAVIPTSDGFIAGRKGSAFRYVIGDNSVKSITLLDGYHIAKYQNGDAASTGYILLEKDARAEGDQVGGLMASFTNLGNTLGLNKVDHYVLVNLDKAKPVPLDVNIQGKTIAEHSNCKRQNDFINKCDDVDFKESLYTKLGLRNNSHYYWSISWVNTPQGPLAFYRTSTKVKVVDIANEQVHTLFSRTLGVNHFELTEHRDGKISIKAKLGFSDENIDDVASFIQNNTTDIEPIQTLGS
ncbi:hypothetical protein [Alteromonas halophila]|uniref:Lipoprotein n=1 Tax=Alteromonas halophila TaxID=516698 RepID=A0A918JBZ6_9ALTE|nr:hypothetical protein [Alteromonas halophila]GGW73318.1 hypothetical protein GCM10007391_01150 [Alteromonas halophila]